MPKSTAKIATANQIFRRRLPFAFDFTVMSGGFVILPTDLRKDYFGPDCYIVIVRIKLVDKYKSRLLCAVSKVRCAVSATSYPRKRVSRSFQFPGFRVALAIASLPGMTADYPDGQPNPAGGGRQAMCQIQMMFAFRNLPMAFSSWPNSRRISSVCSPKI